MTKSKSGRRRLGAHSVNKTPTMALRSSSQMLSIRTRDQIEIGSIFKTFIEKIQDITSKCHQLLTKQHRNYKQFNRVSDKMVKLTFWLVVVDCLHVTSTNNFKTVEVVVNSILKHSCIRTPLQQNNNLASKI